MQQLCDERHHVAVAETSETRVVDSRKGSSCLNNQKVVLLTFDRERQKSSSSFPKQESKIKRIQ